MNALSPGYCRAEDLQPSSRTDSKNFKADEISIDGAEDDICFYAKDAFDSSQLVSLIGLRYTEDKKYNRMGEKESGVYSCYLSADKFSGLTKE